MECQYDGILVTLMSMAEFWRGTWEHDSHEITRITLQEGFLPHSAQRKERKKRKAEECYIFSLDQPTTHQPTHPPPPQPHPDGNGL